MNSFRICGLALAAWILISQTVPASEPVRLTTDGLFKRDLVFCPGGTELAYGVLSLFDGPDKGRVRLMKMKLADGSVTEFAKGAGRELAFSADGNVYAYCVVDNTFMRVAIEVRNVKLDKAMRIERKFFVSRPTLSPDGNRIVFMDPEQLISLELWKDNAKDVVIGEKWDIWPNYSRDGSRVLFTSGKRDKDMEIYSMNPDGTQVKRLTNSPGIDMNAVFSPDGKQIAFTSNRDRNYEIYVMNADGTNVRRVTNHPERDDFPCWTPDGKHLLFVGERKGKFDIYRVDVPQ
jgi:Tol biopolymer transport system component